MTVAPFRERGSTDAEAARALHDARSKFFGPWSATAIKTANYVARAWEVVLVDPVNGSFFVILPAPIPGGPWVAIKSVSDVAHTVTVRPSGVGVTIDSETSLNFSDPRGFILLAPVSRTQWAVVSRERDVTPRYMDNRYDPVGVWWMGNVGGEDDAVPGAVDHSGNGLDLTVEAGGRRYMYIHPKLLGAYFDGTWNLYEATGDASLRITGDMTCMFVTIWTPGVTTDELILGHLASGETEATNAVYSLFTSSSGDWMTFTQENGAGVNDDLATPNRPVRGQIAMVGWVRENNDVTLYINGAVGAPSSSGFVAPTGGSSGKLRVGGGVGANGFQGNMSNLAIYDKALTASQMAERFNFVLGPQYGVLAT